MNKATPALLLAGLAIAASLQARAAEPQTADPQATADADNAVMAAIDARTGQLRPLTAAEARRLSAKAAAMPKGNSLKARAPRTPAEARATQRRHADGSTSMRVPTSAMSSVLVTRGADGSLILTEGQGDVLPTAPQAQQEVMK